LLQLKLSLPPFVFLLEDLLPAIKLLHPSIMFTFPPPGGLFYSLHVCCSPLLLPLFPYTPISDCDRTRKYSFHSLTSLNAKADPFGYANCQCGSADRLRPLLEVEIYKSVRKYGGQQIEAVTGQDPDG
jgi:hypothetical protein